MGRIEIKLVIFADDMTTFVRDKQSYLTLFNVINLFGIHILALRLTMIKLSLSYLEILKRVLVA